VTYPPGGKMKIYFAGSIMGGRENLAVFEYIVEFLKSLGHEVPSEHVARPRVLVEESALTAKEIYERDVAWICSSGAMVAEISTPSLGVGYEIATALHQGKPVLCLHRTGLAISKMITGNDLVILRTYAEIPELEGHLLDFLDRLPSSITVG
jgi:2'-deoxynucleoside 5'-phosphate N-hydrolase